MTKHNAIIRLAEEPMKMIKWFTNEFDKEIGALGIGEMRDGELCVDRLVFPHQIVNAVHVHFKPEDWGPILRELTTDEIGKIIFYWHKHPGCAKASEGDETDTFDVFMPKDTDRQVFGFLQTAKKTNGTIDYEGRIELRHPIISSITNVSLVTDLDWELEEKCQKIIEERITFGTVGASSQPGFQKNKKPDINLPAKTGDTTPNYNWDKEYDAFMDVKIQNGNVIVEASSYFEDMVLDMVDDPEIENLRTKVHQTYPKENMVRIIVQPKRKQLQAIYKFLKSAEDELFWESDEEDEIENEAKKYQNKNGDNTQLNSIKKMFEPNYNMGADDYENDYKHGYYSGRW